MFVLSYNLFVCLFVFSGFKKEQLRVHIVRDGKLHVSGERPLIKDQWSRFRKEFQLPENCNADQVHGKLENGLLTVVLPKLHHRADAEGKDEKVEKGGVKQREADAASRPAPSQGAAVSDEKTKLKSYASMDVRLHQHEGKLRLVCLLVAVVVAAWYVYQKLNPEETQRHDAYPAI